MFLMAATLRPVRSYLILLHCTIFARSLTCSTAHFHHRAPQETMYGQTNCWALPEGKYGAYRGLDGEVYIMTARAALNLSYQVRRVDAPVYSRPPVCQHEAR